MLQTGHISCPKAGLDPNPRLEFESGVKKPDFQSSKVGNNEGPNLWFRALNVKAFRCSAVSSGEF